MTSLVSQYLFTFSIPSNITSTALHSAVLSIVPSDEFLCSAFIRQGVVPSSPSMPSVGFAIHALELFRVAHLRCPYLSEQAFVKTLSDLHMVKYHKYLSRQFSISFDLYLSILGVVNDRVKVALGRDTADWQLQHTCLPCMYKLKEEPSLLFDFLWAQDGNDSLKRIIRRSPTDDPTKPGPSCERTDTRNVLGDLYISREDVNKWARELVEKPKPISEGVGLRLHSILRA